MHSLTLTLQDATHSEVVTNVTSFVGEDASGSFGILPGHARFITALVIGLAKFQLDGRNWTYVALPGAVLSVCDDVLLISSRRYMMDDDYTRISQAMQEQLLLEEHKLRSIKESLHHLEQGVLRYLWGIRQKGSA
ncbi:F0F1 ATP synthase subunit epsilon [Desulfogranum japonicum]|uniref:F0F1 ATP synthase subunit epsilon n=1 Tax=Desulfogranum japonicum TaxID=231447 RepID=UPI00040CC496|nr:ATP synthase F0F1 subunit epsilon [Desulfogranum japonicum]